MARVKSTSKSPKKCGVQHLQSPLKARRTRSSQGRPKNPEGIGVKVKKVKCPYACGTEFASSKKTKEIIRDHIRKSCKEAPKDGTPLVDLNEYLGFGKTPKVKKVKCPYACGSEFPSSKRIKANITYHLRKSCKEAPKDGTPLVDLNQYLGSRRTLRRQVAEAVETTFILCPNGCHAEFRVTYGVRSQIRSHMQKECKSILKDETLDLGKYVEGQLRIPSSSMESRKIQCPNRCGSRFFITSNIFATIRVHLKGSCITTAPADWQKQLRQQLSPTKLAALSLTPKRLDTVYEFEIRPECNSNPIADGITYEEYRKRHGFTDLVFDTNNLCYREKLGQFEKEASVDEINTDMIRRAKSNSESTNSSAESWSKNLDADVNDAFNFSEDDTSGFKEDDASDFDEDDTSGFKEDDASDFDKDDASDFEVGGIENNFNESQVVLKLLGLQRQTKMGQYMEKDPKSTPLALRNQTLIDQHNIATPPDSAKCRGVTWRHGKFPCPYSDKLTKFNGTIRKDRGRFYNWSTLCYACQSLIGKIRYWMMKSRRNALGEILCAESITCIQPKDFGSIKCPKHRDEDINPISKRGIALRKRRRSSYKKKLSPSVRPELVQITPEDLEGLLQLRARGRVQFPAEWKIVHRTLYQKEADDLFFLDTEFGKGADGLIWLFEIAILNSKGDCILNTTIDHNCTVQELFDHPKMSDRCRRTLCKIYNVSFGSPGMATTQTHGLTCKALGDTLKRLIPLGSRIMQWSSNHSDYHVVVRSVSEDSIPPKEQWMQAIPAWISIVPGVSLALDDFYGALYPGCSLNASHHRAKLDTEKLYRAMEKMVEYIKFDEPLKRRRGTKHIAKDEEFDDGDYIDNTSRRQKDSVFDTEFSSESGLGERR